ncbi:MAG: hypothetical protein R3B89_25960 [Polyangiaceae bacterium]
MSASRSPRSRTRHWRTAVAFLLSSAASFTAFATGGCSTDAVGITTCREIEDTRCEAAAQCGIEGAEDVDACKRFYRDHCLHGLGLEGEPRGSDVRRCKAVISGAGECAKQGVTDPAQCAALQGQQLASTIQTVCDVVLQPEDTTACRFLVPDEEDLPDGGSAGAGGSSGGAGGAGGSAGSSSAGTGGSSAGTGGSSAGAAGSGG